MFNIALTWALLISFHFSAGGKAISIAVPPEALRLLPAYQQYIANIFANYWLPAILIYILLRVVDAQKYLRPSTGIHSLLGAANVLLAIYVCMRIFTSTIPGGGASFALMSLSAYVLIPCKIALYGGTIWLIVRSLRLNYKKITPTKLLSQPLFKSTSGIIALVMLFPPVGYFTWAYASNYESIQTVLLKEKKEHSRFVELCESAKVTINKRAKKITEVYFSSSNTYYKDILRDLDFVEVKFNAIKKTQKLTIKADIPTSKKLTIYDINREDISTPTARYQIKSSIPFSNDPDRKRGFHTEETTILDRTNNEVLAKYFTVTRTNGSKIVDSCPKNFFFYEGNIVKYVLGMTDEIDTKGFDVRIISD